MKQTCLHCRHSYSEMEVLDSSVDNLQLLNYALWVGFVDWEISKNWVLIVMNVAVVVIVMWAFGISWSVKNAQSRPVSHSSAIARKISTTATGKESSGASTGITEGSNKSVNNFSQERIYIKCEGSLDEFIPKRRSCVEEAERSRGRDPVLKSYCLSGQDKRMDFVNSIDMSCSRDSVMGVWDNGVGKRIHDTKLYNYAITVEGNCLIQNSPKSVLLSSIMCSEEEKSWLCLWDRRQSVKALSFSLGDEFALLDAVEFNDTKMCVSDGLNDKLFDLRMAASPVVEVYPSTKRFEAPIGRQNQSAKTWNCLEGLVWENTAGFAFSERGKHGIMEWKNACISCSGSLHCILK